MDSRETIQALRQIEQLAMGLHAALKHSPPQIRPILSRAGFTTQRRIAIQRSTWVMVGQIRKEIQALEVKK